MASILTHTVPISGKSLPKDEIKKDIAYEWIKTGDSYISIENSQLYNNLPAGVYTVIYDTTTSDYKIIEINLQHDHIYNLNDSIVNAVIDDITAFWSKTELYKQHCILQKRGILLEGPPGTSKTTTINCIIQQIIKNNGIVFLINNSESFLNTIYALKNKIRKVEPTTPIVTIIEDVDQLLAEFGTEKVILDFLDGEFSINHHLTILTSNNTTSLSSALLRPGRIDTRVVLELPNDELRKEYFKQQGIVEKLDDYVTLTKGFNYSQLKEVFIQTVILEKDLTDVTNYILNPLPLKNYLINSKSIQL